MDRIQTLLEDRSAGPRTCRKVFVSYSGADSEFVLSKLCPELAGVVDGLWLDRLGGTQGVAEATRDSIEHGVYSADLVIAVVSPAYIKSEDCGFEMTLAVKHGRPIVPLVLGVPLKSWPPETVGVTKMTSQFKEPKSGDPKLFVDVTNRDDFDSKYQKELLPRILKGDPVRFIKERLNDCKGSAFVSTNRQILVAKYVNGHRSHQVHVPTFAEGGHVTGLLQAPRRFHNDLCELTDRAIMMTR